MNTQAMEKSDDLRESVYRYRIQMIRARGESAVTHVLHPLWQWFKELPEGVKDQQPAIRFEAHLKQAIDSAFELAELPMRPENGADGLQGFNLSAWRVHLETVGLQMKKAALDLDELPKSLNQLMAFLKDRDIPFDRAALSRHSSMLAIQGPMMGPDIQWCLREATVDEKAEKIRSSTHRSNQSRAWNAQGYPSYNIRVHNDDVAKLVRYGLLSSKNAIKDEKTDAVQAFVTLAFSTLSDRDGEEDRKRYAYRWPEIVRPQLALRAWLSRMTDLTDIETK